MFTNGHHIKLGNPDFLLNWSKEHSEHCIAEFNIREGATYVLLKHVHCYRIFAFQVQESECYQYSWMDSYKTLEEGFTGLAALVERGMK